MEENKNKKRRNKSIRNSQPLVGLLENWNLICLEIGLSNEVITQTI